MTDSEDLMPARHQRIIELVSESGFISIEELAVKFEVTPQTIRRDLSKLSMQGLLKRFHGGASVTSSVRNIAYQTRKSLYFEEKVRIAEFAAEHIPDNASIFINIGTTTEEVAKALARQRKGLKVITNNLNVASILGKSESFEVIITNSRRTYLITDSSKFGRNAMVRLGDLSDIDTIFTDSEPPKEYRQAIADAGVSLYLAKDAE